MSRARMTISRLLAIGGLAGASISSYALYKNSLLGEQKVFVECDKNHNYSYENTLLPPSVKWDEDWDWRKASKTKKVTEREDIQPPPSTDQAVSSTEGSSSPKATRHILLVRHGQYNMESKDDKDRILTELGRKQAVRTGERLRDLNINFNKIVTSTMTRAQETTSLIAGSLPDIPIEECALLREGAPYPPEPPSKGWKPEKWQFFQDNPRIEGAFRKYIHRAHPDQIEDTYDLVVCHGNVIRYIVCRALQFPAEGWLRMSVGHCGVTWITIRPNGRVSLRGLGDIGHLPPDMISYS